MIKSLVSPCHIAQVQPCDCTSAKENYSWSSFLPSMCMHNGWLKPEALLGSHGNSEIKLPKARILLRWLTFPALDFRCTVPPIGHPIIVGVFRWIGYLEPALWEPRGLPLWDRCCLAHLRPFKVFNFEGRQSLRGSLILVMLVSGLHIDLDQLKNVDIVIHAGGNVGVVSLSICACIWPPSTSYTLSVVVNYLLGDHLPFSSISVTNILSGHFPNLRQATFHMLVQVHLHVVLPSHG